MNTEDKLYDDLIDYIIDYRDKSKSKSKSNKSSKRNEQLSVQIGADRKEMLYEIAADKKLDISKVTREILDFYFDFYFGHGGNITRNFTAPWISPRESMKC